MYKLFQCEVREGTIYSLGLYTTLSFETKDEVAIYLLMKMLVADEVYEQEFFMEDIDANRWRWNWTFMFFYPMNRIENDAITSQDSID